MHTRLARFQCFNVLDDCACAVNSLRLALFVSVLSAFFRFDDTRASKWTMTLHSLLLHIAGSVYGHWHGCCIFLSVTLEQPHSSHALSELKCGHCAVAFRQLHYRATSLIKINALQVQCDRSLGAVLILEQFTHQIIPAIAHHTSDQFYHSSYHACPCQLALTRMHKYIAYITALQAVQSGHWVWSSIPSVTQAGFHPEGGQSRSSPPTCSASPLKSSKHY